MEKVALEILKYPDKCNFVYIDRNGCTVLMLAIKCNMEKLALEILKYPDKCKLDNVNKIGNTSLQLAIMFRMEKVALIIFDNSKIDYSNFIGIDNTLLQQVIIRKMEKLALKILNYPDKCKLDYIDKNRQTALQTSNNIWNEKSS